MDEREITQDQYDTILTKRKEQCDKKRGDWKQDPNDPDCLICGCGTEMMDFDVNDELRKECKHGAIMTPGKSPPHTFDPSDLDRHDPPVSPHVPPVLPHVPPPQFNFANLPSNAPSDKPLFFLNKSSPKTKKKGILEAIPRQPRNFDDSFKPSPPAAAQKAEDAAQKAEDAAQKAEAAAQKATDAAQEATDAAQEAKDAAENVNVAVDAYLLGSSDSSSTHTAIEGSTDIEESESAGKSSKSKSPSPDKSPKEKSPSPDKSPKEKSPSPEKSPKEKSPSPIKSPKEKSPSPEKSPKEKSPSPEKSPKEKSPSPKKSPKEKSPSPKTRTVGQLFANMRSRKGRIQLEATAASSHGSSDSSEKSQKTKSNKRRRIQSSEEDETVTTTSLPPATRPPPPPQANTVDLTGDSDSDSDVQIIEKPKGGSRRLHKKQSKKMKRRVTRRQFSSQRARSRRR
jgi:hypothetical protein